MPSNAFGENKCTHSALPSYSAPSSCQSLSLPASASLVGTSVTGSLTFSGDPSNYFNPGYGFVPASGYLNFSGVTVTVSNSAVEFGYDDGASRISADFSDNKVTISDLIELSGPTNGFQMTFTDSAFGGKGLIANSNRFSHQPLLFEWRLDHARLRWRESNSGTNTRCDLFHRYCSRAFFSWLALPLSIGGFRCRGTARRRAVVGRPPNPL